MVRVILFIAILLLQLGGSARTIFVNATSATYNPGSATGSGTLATPWDFSKIQAEANKTAGSEIVPGDSILFNRGQVYRGTLVWRVSGAAGAPIYVGAYGSGPLPVISGFVNLTAFPGKVGNQYTSLSFSNLPACKTVVVNGELIPPGRWPNDAGTVDSAIGWGWLRSSATGSTTTFKTTFSRIGGRAGAAALVGSTAHVRTSRWTIDSVRIGSFTVSEGVGTDSVVTLTYSKGATQYAHPLGYGAIFTGKKEYLDLDKEWTYEGGALTVYLQNSSTQYDIRAAKEENILTVIDADWVNFHTLRLEGANYAGLQLEGTASNLTFVNGEIQYCGSKAVNAHQKNSVANIMVIGSKLYDLGNFGIDHREAGRFWTVKDCDFRRIGHLPGMAVVENSNQSCAIRGGGLGADGHAYINNEFRVIGYSAIRFNGDDTRIMYNKFWDYCYLLDDTGAIYSVKTTSKDATLIKFNYVDGANAGNPLQGAGVRNTIAKIGIYIDDEGHGSPGREIWIDSNIVVNAPRSGVYLHNNHDIHLRGNSFYNNKESQMQIITDLGATRNTYKSDDTAHNIHSHGNKLLSTSTANADEIVKFFAVANTPAALTNLDEQAPWIGQNNYNGIDSNYYFKPFHASTEWVYAIYNYIGTTANVAAKPSIAKWAETFGHDKATKVSPVKFAGTTQPDTAVKFYYNIGTQDTVINLTKSYKNERGEINYPGTLILKPWETVMLFRYEASAPPPPPPPPPPPVEPGETDVVGYRGPYAVTTKTGKRVTYGPYLVVKYEPVYRQNFFTNSEALEAFNRSAAVTVAANAAQAPNDSLFAEAFTTTVSASSLQHNIWQPGATKLDTVYTISVHAKTGTHRYLQLYTGTTGFGPTVFGNFDLQTGTVTFTGTGVLASGIMAKKNGWYECWITGKATAAAASGVNNSFNLIDNPTAARARFYVSPTATTLYLWGAQYATGEKRGYTKTTSTPKQ
ncbi:parallel beta-helix repeat (two copies) [Cnuella takakiae]|uniref:Parallel beta-helix repeat (Two copies) n=1 Tax=Cnuella takakiae TaxID=1302690 RepID=A0A1M5G285_9BACT|nr:hypothetical protein [Cnuella takakiae]OLY92304.1 hypothetical protein BUE76_10660 [Cnuella takakiae]SHF97838.1 parallel beta-helix repeat (two copies) [Cnuella takakiae]